MSEHDFRDDHPAAWSYHHQSTRTPYNMHGLNPPTYTVPPFKELPDAPTLPLPPPALPDGGFDRLIRSRHSCRQFRPDELPLGALSTLLYAGYGVLGARDLDGEFLERPVPSGGALYPLELYVLAQRVGGLPGGAWHYVPLGHLLERVHDHELPALFTSEMFLGQAYLAQAAAIIVITSVVERSLWKYEDRGYRYILLEAGHVAQNLNLCAAGLELGALNLGGFFDRDVLGILRAEERTEIALYGVAIGRPATTDPMDARRPSDEAAVFRRY